MKQVFKTIAFFMAVSAALTACKAELKESLETPHEIAFSVGEVEDPVEDEAGESVGIETRTVFGTATDTSVPVLWTAAQNVDIFYTIKSGITVKELSVTPTFKGKTAKFVGTVKPSSGTSFTLLSPAACYSSHSGTSATVVVPTTQSPSSSSPDEKAMILGAATGNYVSLPATVKFSPKHMTAYFCIMLKNTSIGSISSVTVTAPVVLSGSGTFDFSTSTPSLKSASSGTSNSVTAKVSNLNPVWLACFPAKLSGKKLTIDVVGTSGSLTRTITVPSGKNLEPGKIAVLVVDMNPAVAVTGVTVSPTTLTLEKGKTSTLTATVSPSNATDKTVIWSSSNTSVATVSSDGVVTGVAAGTATITATTNDGGKTATCAVTVTAPKATSVEILNKNSGVDALYDNGMLHLTPKISGNIQYKVTYSDGSTTTNSGATLSINSGSGVSVSGRTISCTEVDKTVTIKVTATSNTSAYATITVRTWSEPTKVSLTIDTPNQAKWCIEKKTYHVVATVEPSTARQKVNFTPLQNDGLWTVTRIGNLDFTITDDNYHGFSGAQEYLNLETTFDLSAWHRASIHQNYSFCPTNIDMTLTKPFDFVAYSTSLKEYRIIDGGLRVLLKTSRTSSLYQIKDFYCEPINLVVPSGFKIVGIVTAYFNGDEDRVPSALGLANKSQLATRGPNGEHLQSGRIHGFAIAMYNAVADIWCAENESSESNANWSRELLEDNVSIPTFQSANNQMNGFNLTVAAHQYNVWRGSSHAIRPPDRCWDYGEPGVELTCCAFPKSNPSLTFIMRPWFVPTVWNWLHIADANGKFYNTKVMNQINAQITKAGFGDKVFPYSTDSYWTINTHAAAGANDDHYAYIVYSDGYATRAKSASAGVRPFLIF